MVLQTVLRALPFGENMKVFLGTSLICGLAYMPIYLKGDRAVGYDNMAEKREAMKNQELADREAARAAKAG